MPGYVRPGMGPRQSGYGVRMKAVTFFSPDHRWATRPRDPLMMYYLLSSRSVMSSLFRAAKFGS